MFRRIGLTRIADVTGLDCLGIPVAVAIRPCSKSLTTSQGKGTTRALARVSAAMESIEFWHAENPPPPVIMASYEQLCEKGDVKAMDPELFSSGPFSRILDLRFHCTGWVWGQDLVRDAPILVPAYCNRLDFDCGSIESIAIRRSSNGLASGNTQAEATCHALYEVVERDAFARWEDLSPRDLDRTEVDVSSIQGTCGELIEAFLEANLSVRIWDQTSSIGVPTFYCIIRQSHDLRGLTTFGGHGTHWDRDIAMSRAITEAAQSRLTIITGSRDDTHPWQYDEFQVNAGTELPLSEGSDLKSFDDCLQPDYRQGHEANRSDLVKALVAAGYECVVVVDMAKEEIGIPVVYVHVPGLRHKKH